MAIVALAFGLSVACSSGGNNNNNQNNTNSNNSNGKVTKNKDFSVCPGAAGCDDNQGDLKAGTSKVAISPLKYEIARWSYFKEKGFCPKPTPLSSHGRMRCGELQSLAAFKKRDCGLDGLCPGEKLKTRVSCDKDGKCPNEMVCKTSEKRCYIHYKAPDADGSEKDGLKDYFLDCGRDRICPCLGPKDEPAYFGKGKKCLIGHKANPAYKGPDADGSEGNGKFDVLWMGGFSQNHPIQGKHDDTWARSLVLQTGGTTVAIVSLDVVGFFFDDVEKVRKLVNEQLPKGAIDFILVSSTHTHEGPDTLGQWGPGEDGVPAATGTDPDYQKKVIRDLAKSILDAYKDLKPATLKAGQLRTGVQGLVRDSRDPVVIDDTMVVLQAIGKDGTPIATIVNWGNHPEVLSDINNFSSSDFCHYLREAMEKGLPATGKNPKVDPIPGVAIFLQGAVGGLMTPLGIKIPDLEGKLQSSSNWDKAKALGEQLALKAQEALKSGKMLEKPSISVWSRTFNAAVENQAFQAAFFLGVFLRGIFDFDDSLPTSKTNLPHVKTQISLIRIGDVTFFSAPGELDPEVLVGGYDGKWSGGYKLTGINNKDPNLLAEMKKNAPKGPYLKDKIPGLYKAFVGLGNDELGYLLASWNYKLHPTKPYYDDPPDHYEETNSLGPSVVPQILKLYDEMLVLVKVKK